MIPKEYAAAIYCRDFKTFYTWLKKCPNYPLTQTISALILIKPNMHAFYLFIYNETIQLKKKKKYSIDIIKLQLTV